MTLVEIKNQILILFSKNNTFFTSDFSKINLDASQEEIREELITQAVSDLCEEEICREIFNPNDGKVSAYILISPQNTQLQQVTISFSTASLVCEILEQYSRGTNQQLQIDVSNIKEEDIQNLCLIIAQLLQSQN